MLGTNKSGALKTVLDEFSAFEQQQNSDATFECGTLEGLMTDLKANKQSRSRTRKGKEKRKIEQAI